MARIIPFTAVLVLCTATAIVLAQDDQPDPLPADAEPAEELIDDREAERPPGERGERDDPAARAVLDRVLPEVTFDGVGLSDVLDFLRDVTNANIFVNWRALEGAGIDRNAPVNMRLRQVSFGKALEILLEGVGGDEVPLAYTIDRGSSPSPPRAPPPTPARTTSATSSRPRSPPRPRPTRPSGSRR